MKKYRSEKAGQTILQTYDLLLKEWHTPFQEQDIPTRYGTTHVITAGNENAPALLLFHGVGDDSALMWIYNAAHLAKFFRLYAVDTLGGPGKSVPGAAYGKNFDDVIWIDDVFAGLKLESAFVAGVSHGAYMTKLYALHRPEKVKKALCISSSVIEKGAPSPMMEMMKIFLPEALFPTKKNTLRLLRKLSGDHSEVFTHHPLILAHYQALLRGFNNMAMGFHQVDGFTKEEIDRIRGKIYFLVGEKDPFQIRGGKKKLLDYQLPALFYPDAGHGLNHELAEKINQKITEYFLNE